MTRRWSCRGKPHHQRGPPARLVGAPPAEHRRLARVVEDEGRAGVRGDDVVGDVEVLGPQHEVEDQAALAQAPAAPARRRRAPASPPGRARPGPGAGRRHSRVPETWAPSSSSRSATRGSRRSTQPTTASTTSERPSHSRSSVSPGSLRTWTSTALWTPTPVSSVSSSATGWSRLITAMSTGSIHGWGRRPSSQTCTCASVTASINEGEPRSLSRALPIHFRTPCQSGAGAPYCATLSC